MLDDRVILDSQVMAVTVLSSKFLWVVHLWPQVAINWCICKGALPIPGAKNAKQLQEIAGAVGWRLSDGEMMELDGVSSRPAASSMGAPFENW